MIKYENIAPKTALVTPTNREVAVVNGMDLATGNIASTNYATISGADMLDRTVQVLGTYAKWPKPEDIVVTALLVAGTHFVDNDGLLVFPDWARWLAVAPRESGKSRMLKLIMAMSRDSFGPLDGGDVTSKGIRNALDQHMTIGLDEAHLALGAARGYDSLKSVLLHYQNGGGSATGVGGISEYNTFGPVFMAAQPSLMTGTKDRLLDLFTRCFVIFPEYTDEEIPDLDNLFKARAEFVEWGLSRWAAQERPGYGQYLEPVFPVSKRLKSRKREIAKPLLAIADHAEDLRHPEGTADRNRWSIIARNAVNELLLGEGDPQRALSKGEELFKEMNDAPLREMEAALFNIELPDLSTFWAA